MEALIWMGWLDKNGRDGIARLVPIGLSCTQQNSSIGRVFSIMPIFPFILLPLAVLAVGLVLLAFYLRDIRKPVLIGLHVLLGFGALEVMVMLLKGTPNGESLPAGEFGNLSAGFFALAGFIGLLSPILGRRSHKTALGLLLAHGSAGLVGVLLCIVWISTLSSP